MWAELAPIGRSTPTGGYRRYAWSEADLECRSWFVVHAQDRGLSVEADGNGNLWAWWGDRHAGDAVVVGSHLDSVPDGGAFDGPLGVVSAFAAVDALRVNGPPRRPVGVVAFSDEEGARFGVACAGSRLLTGTLEAERALQLRGSDGLTMADAMRAAGHDPELVGPDPQRLAAIGTIVELHIEQGRMPVEVDGETVHGLAGARRPIGVASEIWPHGRWRLDLAGRADHAGTTALGDRSDPMLRLAAAAHAARAAAERHDALATIGKVVVEPNGANAIPSLVTAWLDVRGGDSARVRSVVTEVAAAAGTEPVEESWTAGTTFDEGLRDRVVAVLEGVPLPGGGGRELALPGLPELRGSVPVLATGAGHDAGVLSAAGVRAAMIFVRNPTGVSHSPLEHADPADRAAGVAALARVIKDLAF